MDRRKINSVKEELKPFIEKLKENGKTLCTSCITPVVWNDNSSPFTLEVQANWIDDMECLEAISYLFDILKEVNTPPEVMNSLFAIQVVGMNSEIKCSQLNYVVFNEEGCFA